jgi:hypothetical protein
MSRLGVTYDGVLDWMNGLIAHCTITHLGTTGTYSAIADIHTFQLTVTQPLGLSVFTSRIMATDLWQSHCNFKTHMKSYFHSLIHFWPLFYNCQFRRLDSIQFLCSHVRIPAGWRLETRLFISEECSLLFYASEHLFIITLNGPCRKHSLYY